MTSKDVFLLSGSVKFDLACCPREPAYGDVTLMWSAFLLQALHVDLHQTYIEGRHGSRPRKRPASGNSADASSLFLNRLSPNETQFLVVFIERFKTVAAGRDLVAIHVKKSSAGLLYKALAIRDRSCSEQPCLTVSKVNRVIWRQGAIR